MRFLIGLICLVFVGCAAGTTIVIPPSDVGRGAEIPPQDLRIGLFNPTSRWLKIEGLVGMLGAQTLILGPKQSVTLEAKRYGQYGGIVTAYRQGQVREDGAKLSGFISQEEFELSLDGDIKKYEEEFFGDYKVFDGFRYDPHRPFPSIGLGQLIRIGIEN